MLVLSRKPNESIKIGDHITVTVLKVNPGAVRIGIDAPKEMNIMRDELLRGEAEIVSEPPPQGE